MRPWFAVPLVLAALAGSARAADVTETDVFLKTATGMLWATQAQPPSAVHGPVAVILAGSGPTDRNGDGPSMHTDTYKMLAAGLAAQGVTSFRTDKRGVGESVSAAVSESDLRIQNYAADARAWADEARARTGAPCVWLIGHSEGALLAELTAQNPAGICGLVLISGAGRKAGDVLREQLGSLPEPLKAKAYDIIGQLEAGHTVAQVPPQLAALFRPSVQPYLISWLAIDPAALLGAQKLPVLILQGDTDIQVGVVDAKRLAAAKPDAKLVILPGVNHILKNAPADRAANIATYGDPTLPLSPGIVDTIAGFLKSP